MNHENTKIITTFISSWKFIFSFSAKFLFTFFRTIGVGKKVIWGFSVQ